MSDDNIVMFIHFEGYPKQGLTDYKFFCFNGQPKFLYVATGSTGTEEETFLDLNWNLTSFKRLDYPEHSIKPQKPGTFGKMVEIAKVFSENIPFLRVDFYEVDGHVYCGELTFSPGSGLMHFSPDSADKEIGRLLSLNNS